jgi:hypothetical protein
MVDREVEEALNRIRKRNAEMRKCLIEAMDRQLRHADMKRIIIDKMTKWLEANKGQ